MHSFPAPRGISCRPERVADLLDLLDVASVSSGPRRRPLRCAANSSPATLPRYRTRRTSSGRRSSPWLDGSREPAKESSRATSRLGRAARNVPEANNPLASRWSTSVTRKNGLPALRLDENRQQVGREHRASKQREVQPPSPGESAEQDLTTESHAAQLAPRVGHRDAPARWRRPGAACRNAGSVGSQRWREPRVVERGGRTTAGPSITSTSGVSADSTSRVVASRCSECSLAMLGASAAVTRRGDSQRAQQPVGRVRDEHSSWRAAQCSPRQSSARASTTGRKGSPPPYCSTPLAAYDGGRRIGPQRQVGDGHVDERRLADAGLARHEDDLSPAGQRRAAGVGDLRALADPADDPAVRRDEIAAASAGGRRCGPRGAHRGDEAVAATRNGLDETWCRGVVVEAPRAAHRQPYDVPVTATSAQTESSRAPLPEFRRDAARGARRTTKVFGRGPESRRDQQQAPCGRGERRERDRGGRTQGVARRRQECTTCLACRRGARRQDRSRRRARPPRSISPASACRSLASWRLMSCCRVAPWYD